MTQERENSVLRRKAEAGRAVPETRAMTPERAIGQALARVAQEQLDLDLRVAELSDLRRSLAELPEMLPDLSLLAVIEGPQEALGLVALSPEVLSVLIEMQTTGRLGRAPPAPRKPTRIDAAMAVEFVDGLLEAVEEALIEQEAIAWAGGFRFASHLDDPRPLGLLLEDVTYRVWQATLSFGAGEREGTFFWAVPQTGRGAGLRRMPDGASAQAVGGAGSDADAPGWQASLERAVMGAPAQLEAVLHRVTLPLSAVMEFYPGLDLPLPADALDRLTLEAQGRRRLSGARLGQRRGMRALRLTGEEEAPDLDASDDRFGGGGFSAGASPFPEVEPMEPALGGLGDPMNPAYGLPDGDAAFGGTEEGEAPPLPGLPEMGDDAEGFGAMPMGGFAETEPGDAPDFPPLKIGSGL
ncbi:FliM/FliN family flagellar motor switch protein [Thioclava atlantica]|uniref:Surface presentation of antigens (SPOA) protein n=1 Tax=Thioclava atlantica TaxID=1317124 RepID=A0A085TYM7_9RHOB|nr:FliM/FliN family flagellar motor switch protein [Thioclava atlantica]KFE35824.1 surface presentation of antigens (SPOA) protein [Thioclava atlantica]